MEPTIERFLKIDKMTLGTPYRETIDFAFAENFVPIMRMCILYMCAFYDCAASSVVLRNRYLNV